MTKDPANPVFTGSGAVWDRWAVRETELFKGPQYFHVLYGGFDGEVWRIGHVRTRDFRTFEVNPYNPIFTPSDDPDAWDCDGVLTPQVIQIGDAYWMVYAGKRGQEWQTELAKAWKVDKARCRGLRESANALEVPGTLTLIRCVGQVRVILRVLISKGRNVSATCVRSPLNPTAHFGLPMGRSIRLTSATSWAVKPRSSVV